MTLTIVNATRLKVSEEIEKILNGYLNPICQRVLQDWELRQKLIEYVLSQIPNHYLAIEAEKQTSLTSQLLYYSTIEQLEIENLIIQGVYYLRKVENATWYDS